MEKLFCKKDFSIPFQKTFSCGSLSAAQKSSRKSLFARHEKFYPSAFKKLRSQMFARQTDDCALKFFLKGARGKAFFSKKVFPAKKGILMNRSERLDDPVEAQRLAQEGAQAEIWTALPGIIAGFDPAAMTVSVQPAVAGSIRGEDGKASSCRMPLLVDVPVVFPCGGGFTLTHPIKAGDEALVVFSSRCIDGWWQQGDAAPPPDSRMHDLSDGMAIVGMRSQTRKLDPPVDPENVQLRSDDGKTVITMTAQSEIRLECEKEVKIKAPNIVLEGNVTTTGQGGGAGSIAMTGDIALTGGMQSTGDVLAEGVSVAHHKHPETSEPI